MKLVKQITKDNKTLSHYWYRDDFGFIHNATEITITKEDGRRINYPFMPPLKAIALSKNTAYTGEITQYTDEEYEEMLSTVGT